PPPRTPPGRPGTPGTAPCPYRQPGSPAPGTRKRSPSSALSVQAGCEWRRARAKSRAKSSQEPSQERCRSRMCKDAASAMTSRRRSSNGWVVTVGLALSREFLLEMSVALGKSCGECTLCCKVLVIEELDKDAGLPCSNC